MNERVILHCDLNNFFASVESLAHPEFKTVPMAVAGSSEDRHGIILAKNELAKKFGVQTAEPIWQARKKCPDLVLAEPHYHKYAEYSKKVFEVSKGAQDDDLDGSLSYLNAKEKEMLCFLLEKRLLEFTPIDVSKLLGVTNKTIINRCARLTNHGFLVPNIVSQRIRSYSLSEFTKQNQKRILARISI